MDNKPAVGGPELPRVLARLARQTEVALAEADLTLSQYRVLMYLSEGTAAASYLAAALAVSPPSVTGVVDVLVTRGLVAREAVPGDRRQVAHTLTTAGREALDRADQAVNDRLAWILDHHQRPAVTTRALDGLRAWQLALDTCRAATSKQPA